MFHKVIVMEINSNYVIVLKEDGEMVRIKYKDGLNIGDKIYILNEDIVEKPQSYAFLSNVNTRKVASILAVLILALCIYQIRPIKAYALVSIDGNQSLELRVDKKGKIASATSLNNSYSENELKNMKGKNISDIKVDGAKVVAIASLNDILDKKFIDEILDNFDDDIYYIEGDSDDIDIASKNNTSLGIYLVNEAISEDKLEDILEDKPVSELYQVFKDNPQLLQDEDMLDILEDKIDEENEKLEEENDSDDEIDDDLQDKQDDLE